MDGGLAGTFWSLLWVCCGHFFVVLSLAELASAAPTAGAQYHWVSEHAPPDLRKFVSFCSGCLSTISWQSMVAVDCYIVADIVQAMLQVGNFTYQPEQWHCTLLIMATVVVVSAFNLLLARHLSIFEGLFATCHFFAFVPVAVALLIMAPKRSPSKVFLHFTDNGGGWPNMGMTVLVGQVSNMFVVLGCDGIAHLAEEIEDCSTVLPRGMVWAYLINVPLTVVMALVYCFSIDSIPEAVKSTSAFVTVFHTAFVDRTPTLAFAVVVLGLILMTTTSVLASASRQVFAFSRGKALPYSDWLSTINHRHGVPANSIFFTAFVTIGLSLVNLGSTAAFDTMISLANVSLMATYLISIGCVTIRRIRGPPLPPARWSLGMHGLLINCIAMMYSAWAFFWSFWPTTYAAQATSFNWAVIFFVCLCGCALLMYYHHTRYIYEDEEIMTICISARF